MMNDFLKKNRLKEGTRTYNSGRISGLSFGEVEDKFENANREIEGLGLKAVNPLKTWIPNWAPWCVHMAADLCLLATCRGIYLQADWESSRGAKIEKRVAEKLGIAVMYQREYLYAKELDETADKIEAFRNMYLRGVKFRFEEKDRIKLAKVMEAAKRLGVTWVLTDGTISPDQDPEFFPKNGFLYVWEDRHGSLHFAHGGFEAYYTGETEIGIDEFLLAYSSVMKGGRENG